jgi:hypothetical protein
MQLDLRDLAMVGAALLALALALVFIFLIWSAALGHPLFSLPGWHSPAGPAPHAGG